MTERSSYSWTDSKRKERSWASEQTMASSNDEAAHTLPLPVPNYAPPHRRQNIRPRGRRLFSKATEIFHDLSRRWNADVGKSSVSSMKASSTRPHCSGSVAHLPQNSDDLIDDGEYEFEAMPTTKGDSPNVDHVAVDREWGDQLNGENEKQSTTDDESPPPKSDSTPPDNTISREFAEALHSSPSYLTPWVLVRWAFWPHAKKFIAIRGMLTDDLEEQFRRDEWFIRSKPLARWTALWFVLNWIMACAVVPKPFVLMDHIYYWGIAPAFSFPPVFMVLYDWPYYHPVIYQSFLVFSVWMWSIFLLIYMYLCGKFNEDHALFSCGDRDFLTTFYYTTAMQTLALFALKLDRLPAVIGAIGFFVLEGALIVPDRSGWGKVMVNFAVYHAFILYIHYQNEKEQITLFQFQQRLKAEKKFAKRSEKRAFEAAKSKQKLTSYIFHEIRVPLNTAMLAADNMAANPKLLKEFEIEFGALTGSLDMTAKVLNDILDFNRLDRGVFEIVSKPYCFHQTIMSSVVPLRMATSAKQQNFNINLDPEIDVAIRRAAYESLGESSEAASRHIEANPDVYGVVIGDVARVSQIVTNLTSNACKFTPQGGTISVSTKLIMSCNNPLSHNQTFPPPDDDAGHPLSISHLSKHNEDFEGEKPKPFIVVRIEVEDTGPGIDAVDVRKLFTPFKQTERGQSQGSTGSGLGLSLVRGIVKQMGGRTGVRSEKGVGSTFWVELPVGIGLETLQGNNSYPEGSETLTATQATTSGEVERIMDAAHKRKSASMDNISVGRAIDEAAALNAVVAPKTSTKLRSQIMEQGGPVERNSPTNTLSSRGLPTSRSVHDSDPFSLSFGAAATEAESTGAAARPRPLSNSSNPPSAETIHSPGFSSSSAMASVDQLGSSGSLNSSPGAAEFSGLPVLVVDDDKITRTLMRRMLERNGCMVSEAENGQIAAQMVLGSQYHFVEGITGTITFKHKEGEEASKSDSAESPKYALVFLDNQMPIMSGLQTVRTLRRLNRKEYVVGLTGNALQVDQDEFVDAGVDMVITKPAKEVAIKNAVRVAHTRWKRSSQQTGGAASLSAIS